MRIKEIVVVEGRDDTARVREAVDCETIETHGFGIKRETWDEIKEAYERKGIIILTDPDHAGNEIRKRIKEKFPRAKEAFLPRGKAMKGDDIGVENARPEDIEKAIVEARAETDEKGSGEISLRDMDMNGLSGGPGSRMKREKLAAELGIGYGNARQMVSRMNAFGIGKEEFDEACRRTRDQRPDA